MKKDKTKPPKVKKMSRSDKVVEKMRELLKVYTREYAKLKARQEVILQSTRELSSPPRPGIDHRVARIYIKLTDNRHLSVRARIKLACDKFNETRGQRAQIEFNQTLERLVILGAMNHYLMAMKDLDHNLSSP